MPNLKRESKSVRPSIGVANVKKGEVLEFDSPEKLLGNSAGAFARMMAAARRMENSSSANLLNKM